MLGDRMARTVRARAASRAACIWLGMAVVSGLALESARVDVLALVAAFGTLAVICRRPWAIAAALGAAAFLDLTILPWAVAASVISWETGRGFAPPRLDSEPQRQLMRSRRRNEAASVVVVQANRPDGTERLWSSLRVTDGFDVVRGRDGIELRAVLEDQGLDRTAFAQRIREVLDASDVRFGWASFPADGVTLEVLVDEARARLAPADSSAGRPITGTGTVPSVVPAPATAIAEGS